MKRVLIPTALSMMLAGVVWAEIQESPKVEGEYIYNPIGKRDPFRPPLAGTGLRDLSSLSAIEKFSVEQLTLRAILSGDGKSRAMFEDPDGKTHILTEGDLIGREKGTVSRVLTTGVIVTTKTFNYLGDMNLYEKVISLPEK